jgi:hypothetical protein
MDADQAAAFVRAEMATCGTCDMEARLARVLNDP